MFCLGFLKEWSGIFKIFPKRSMGRHVVGIHYHDNRWVSKVLASDPLAMYSRSQASSRYRCKRRRLGTEREFPQQPWQVMSRPESPRTTGDEAPSAMISVLARTGDFSSIYFNVAVKRWLNQWRVLGEVNSVQEWNTCSIYSLVCLAT